MLFLSFLRASGAGKTRELRPKIASREDTRRERRVFWLQGFSQHAIIKLAVLAYLRVFFFYYYFPRRKVKGCDLSFYQSKANEQFFVSNVGK